MVETDLKAFWENDAAGHMGFAYQYGKNPEVRYPMYEVRRDLVLETLNAMPKGCVLDAGCGAAHVLREYLDLGWDGYGFDFAEGMVALAHKELSEHGHDPGRVHVADFTDLSRYPDATFDVALLLGVSQYMPEKDDKAAWGEIYRVLKPNGIVLIDFVNALFDLWTFNRFTIRFVMDELVSRLLPPERLPEIEKKIAALVTNPKKPDTTGLYATRRDHVTKRTENPLTTVARMKTHNFTVEDVRFFRLHVVPPLLFEGNPALEALAIAHEGKLAHHWIGNFVASAFLATLKKA